ncbi:MAG: glutamate--tRNA ligase [Nitrospirota bacterium]
MKEIRVRFAPSPTGFLHIGGARTALFNWLFARHHKGKFFLRIEDTDLSRSTDEAIDAIIDGLRWLGIDWDRWEDWPSDPARQAQRLDIYRRKVDELFEKDMAYRCYCLPEELEARRKDALAQGRTPKYDGRCRELKYPIEGRSHAIRFKANFEEKTVVDDLIKGKVVFDNSNLDDLIILRSDGTPTYNFCVVVDDVDMNISHVIRGDDHLNNTPRQMQLYKALGYDTPEFAHLPMILGADRTRLSKRHGATSVQNYREEGYLPEAMVNYLVRLGWSHKDQEIFSRDELIEQFSLEQVGRSSAVFNPEKLLWLNAHYIKTKTSDELSALLPYYLQSFSDEKSLLIDVITALKERSRTMKEMAESAYYFFCDDIEMDDKAKKFLTPETLLILRLINKKLSKVSFEKDNLERVFGELMRETNLKLAKIAQPLRAVITGKTVSPGIYDILFLIGKERTLSRLNNAIKTIENVYSQ